MAHLEPGQPPLLVDCAFFCRKPPVITSWHHAGMRTSHEQLLSANDPVSHGWRGRFRGWVTDDDCSIASRFQVGVGFGSVRRITGIPSARDGDEAAVLSHLGDRGGRARRASPCGKGGGQVRSARPVLQRGR